jgi:hypothetical protein
MTAIKPTVGRNILFFAEAAQLQENNPRAAIVTNVNADGTINICSFAHNGFPIPHTGVRLVQDGDPNPPTPEYFELHCQWMSYQIGQAAKMEELQAKLNTPASDAAVQTEAAPTGDSPEAG